MELPKEMLYILVPVLFLALALALVQNLTKDSRNFRSSRNRKARRQD